jgi:hypothetical protein
MEPEPVEAKLLEIQVELERVNEKFEQVFGPPVQTAIPAY